MKKRLLAALLCVAMVSSMVIGCGSNSSDTSTDGAAASDEGTDTAEDSTDALNIAIVSSPNGVDDGSMRITTMESWIISMSIRTQR